MAKKEMIPFVSTIAEILGNYWKLSDSEGLKLEAERYVDLHALGKYIEELLDESKPKLIAAKVNELFPDLDLKVAFIEGSAKTEIDSQGVYNDLLAANRQNDFVRIAKLSQTDLKKIDGGELLIAKHKVELAKTADTVKVSALTKDDWTFIKSTQTLG